VISVQARADATAGHLRADVVAGRHHQHVGFLQHGRIAPRVAVDINVLARLKADTIEVNWLAEFVQLQLRGSTSTYSPDGYR
jgi:hypothetical protein